MRSQDVSNQRRNLCCSSIRLTTLRPKIGNSIPRTEDRDQVWAGESTPALQQKDPDIGPILRLLLRQNSRPRAEEVISESDTTKALWRQWNSLVLKDGVLFRRATGKQSRRSVLQLVVSASKRADFIAECHRNTNGGHRAFRTRLDRVRRRGFWMGWRRDVERDCRQCPDCSSFVRGRRLRRSGCFRSRDTGSTSKLWVDENACDGVISDNGSQTAGPWSQQKGW